MKRTLFTVVSIAAASLTSASAGWELAENTAAPAVYPSGTTPPSVMFVCSRGSFQALISTEEADFSAILADTSRRQRNVSGTLMIDGNEVYSGNFSFKPSMKTVVPKATKPSKSLFNAVVRGSQVTLDLGGRGKTDLTLPPADAVFAAFAKDCRS